MFGELVPLRVIFKKETKIILCMRVGMYTVTWRPGPLKLQLQPFVSALILGFSFGAVVNKIPRPKATWG